VTGRILSSSLALLCSFAQCEPSRRPQPDGASHGLSVPSAHARLSGPPIAGIPSTAMFRLQGLATLLAASSRRARAGFVSRRRRSWDSPFGAFSCRKVAGAFPPRMDPHAVSPPVSPTAEAVGRPGRPRLLGFCPSGSPWHDDRRLTRRRLAAPLGFALLRYAGESLDRGCPAISSRTLAGPPAEARGRAAPQSIDQLSLGRCRRPRTSRGRRRQPL
jgi:hypothetical protein